MNVDRTDFGFEQVTPAEKTRRVRGVFTSIADSYDLMNDLMSLGVHRLWKRVAINALAPRRGQRILDLACGTGDLTRLIARRTGGEAEIVCSDINAAMLAHGRDRLLDSGLAGGAHPVQGNAEALPFAGGSFDSAIIAFGLRNVTDKDAALVSLARVLKPGGQLVILEFSRVVIPLLEKIYDAYSFNLLPRIGGIIANDADSYRYLVESIRRHPDQQRLADMMQG
ncbi:MAG: class I SAM-dependent methyltransferase, partial [Gammaproteobacteria bacterium]|nr:class I SAM-dependent methyltransferase [Gammaproteobacteria bacterium]